jgi:hypothetical protein
VIRRSFLSRLTKVAAVSLSPSVLEALPFSVPSNPSDKRAAQMTHGTGSFHFVKGSKGLGFELAIQKEKGSLRVASVQNPVRILYDRRGNGTEKDVEFASVVPLARGLVTSTEFTDARNNRWFIRLELGPWRADGFRCEYSYKLIEGEAHNVFFEHPIVPDLAPSPDDTYVLMPGLLYDGNHLARPDGEVPRLVPANQFQLDTPVLSLSTTATMLYEKASGTTLITKTKVGSALGPSGFSYAIRPDHHQLTVTAPLYREQHFHGHRYDDCTPEGANVSAGQSINVSVYYEPAHFDSLADFFTAFREIREPAPFVRTPRLPMSRAAQIIEKNFNDVNWCPENFYINASPPDYDPVKKGCETLSPDWQLITGWCGGSITGYALLQSTDELSQMRVTAMLDLMSAGGISPSGLFWSNYARGKWDTGNTEIAMHQHMRMPGDAAFFLQKSIALEKTRGREHPNWVQAVVSNLDAFAKLWRENHDFGHFVNRETLKIEETGSAAGALCIGGLALGANLPNGREYLAAAKEAADAYFHRYVETGWLCGGPLDIGITSDSESPTAMLESFVTLYEADRNPVYLKYAQMAADILSSWVVAYNAPFPAGTDCDRIKLQTVGGVLANSRNHHIGPTMATSSGDMFLRLYRYTGEAAYLRVLENIVSGLPQYLCYKPGQFPEMQVGMMSEQYNMTDELGTRGHIWPVNASWGATGLLLSHRALPSIFVDRARRNLAVFDQLKAEADFDANRLRITNETPYEARVSIDTEANTRAAMTLPSGQAKTVSLKTLSQDS